MRYQRILQGDPESGLKLGRAGHRDILGSRSKARIDGLGDEWTVSYGMQGALIPGEGLSSLIPNFFSNNNIGKCITSIWMVY